MTENEMFVAIAAIIGVVVIICVVGSKFLDFIKDTVPYDPFEPYRYRHRKDDLWIVPRNMLKTHRPRPPNNTTNPKA